MLRVGSIVLNVSDAERAAESWSTALGYLPSPSNPAFLLPEGGQGPRVHLDTDDRMHVDLWTSSEEERDLEVARLISLGTKRVVDWEYPEDADFVVLADTEGNLFCVVNAGR